ncbi:Dyp-type peroxidase [Pyxidicoccus fallax]|uniref:Dyp-type peroxidase n=1 Tax=Pyxidicoccus fallax TaxID=394095 RepID=A0A848LFC7_9BACT|nr:Dyp-type peroxidase [Pyxidicoccus fallax]NMO14258.1 Dyp-type peroxidase [Pyxidicoccus fallax]NPC80033.1 Dyp-type peroxidase [Pyxidicoccus fallax]
MSSSNHQPGILEPHCAVGRTLTFRIAPGTDIVAALRRLRDGFPPELGVVGLGAPTVLALGKRVPGLRVFPAMSGPACSVPSTQQALWFMLRGRDRGAVFDASRSLRKLMGDAFLTVDVMDTFTYHGGRDLTRFEDGTENPKGDDAVEAAIVSEGEGLRGSSFVAVQRWVHDLARFEGFEPRERNHVIGRDAETNEELEDAPPTAHVKRTAQESFEPAAFMVRRSMPWASADREGLEFIAYVAKLEGFEQMLRRMVGEEDGQADGLFRFSFPISGGYYWCPPLANGKLDLRALGL